MDAGQLRYALAQNALIDAHADIDELDNDMRAGCTREEARG